MMKDSTYREIMCKYFPDEFGEDLCKPNPALEPYKHKLERLKRKLNRDFKDISSADTDKNELLKSIISIPFDMVEAYKFDFYDICMMVDEETCNELGFSVLGVCDELYEEYKRCYWENNKALIDYYDYIGYRWY